MKLIWIGNRRGAAGVPGIPARDLNADEVERYGGEQFLLRTGLYEKKAIKKVEETKKELD